MLTAHSREHTLSDNSLFNFGMVHDNVVIIDAGSRPLAWQEELGRALPAGANSIQGVDDIDGAAGNKPR